MIDQKSLLDELKSLDAQRSQAIEVLNKIEGAADMVRHLLKKGAQSSIERNGTPVSEGVAVQN